MIFMTHPLTPLYLQRRARRLSAASRRKLAFIAEFGPCSFDTLYSEFYKTPRNRDACRAGLYSLTKAGYLQASEDGAERCWQIGFGVVEPAAPVLPPAARAFARLRTPAPQYDVLRRPVYVPGPSAAPRAGSLDFKRLASHGNRC